MRVLSKTIRTNVERNNWLCHHLYKIESQISNKRGASVVRAGLTRLKERLEGVVQAGNIAVLAQI